jgi:hypothetical protein
MQRVLGQFAEYSVGQVFAATTRPLLGLQAAEYFLLLFYSKNRVLASKFAILNAII